MAEKVTEFRRKSEERNMRATAYLDALVLAYPLDEPIGGWSNQFYIPSNHEVVGAYDHALKVLRERGESLLPERVLQSIRGLTHGNSDFQTGFDIYMHPMHGRLESSSETFKGAMSRFQAGKREGALELFESFWSTEAKEFWARIHFQMRAHSRRERERQARAIEGRRAETSEGVSTD